MPFSKLIARQMQKPSGILGRFIIARGMNRTNRDICQSTIQILKVKTTDRVLDIGFGGGAAMAGIIKLANDGLVAGIEISDAMLKRCRNKFNQSITKGKVEIKKGNASEIPFENNYFDKVYTINCIYFWPDPMVELKEIIRVLKPGGLLVVAVYLKEEFEGYPPSAYGFNIYSDVELQRLLKGSGFSEIRIEHRLGKPYVAVLALGTKKDYR